MYTTKVKTNSLRSNDEVNNFDTLAKLLPRNNGTPAGVSALAESLKRGNAYLNAQQRLNEVCLPEATSQLSNTFIAKGASHA